MTRALVLALAMLSFGSPGALSRVYALGSLIKVVNTVDGSVAVYRDAAGCVVTFQGEVVDSVSLAVCSA